MSAPSCWGTQALACWLAPAPPRDGLWLLGFSWDVRPSDGLEASGESFQTRPLRRKLFPPPFTDEQTEAWRGAQGQPSSRLGRGRAELRQGDGL